MCLIERAATAGILARAVTIAIDCDARVTHQMRSTIERIRKKDRHCP